MSYYVYLLVSSDNGTYVGATVDLTRRLRQHNKEIKGGATATGKKVARGQSWTRVCYVKNFPTWSAALQFEWKWKYVTRKQKNHQGTLPKLRRMLALKEMLKMERSTSKAVAFSEWETPVDIVFEDEEANKFYDNLA
jgi:predicted GIY-YIG superfamily endonuclease